MEMYQAETSQTLLKLTKYWKRYDKLLTSIMVVLVLGFVGVRYWKHHNAVQQSQAANSYQLMLNAIHEKDRDTLHVQGNKIKTDYSRTPYAALAALLLAKDAVDQQDLQQAETELRSISEKQSGNSLFWHIAQVRLARILSLQQKFDEALAVLSKPSNGFVSLFEEAKGDIYTAQGDKASAKVSYLAAAKQAPTEAQIPLLDIKLLDLGVLPDAYRRPPQEDVIYDQE